MPNGYTIMTRGQGREGIKTCLDLPSLLDFVLLARGDETASSASAAMALFPFFVPGMLAGVQSKIVDLYLERLLLGLKSTRL
jgi:hypothetical protein